MLQTLQPSYKRGEKVELSHSLAFALSSIVGCESERKVAMRAPRVPSCRIVSTEANCARQDPGPFLPRRLAIFPRLNSGWPGFADPAAGTPPAGVSFLS